MERVKDFKKLSSPSVAWFHLEFSFNVIENIWWRMERITFITSNEA